MLKKILPSPSSLSNANALPKNIRDTDGKFTGEVRNEPKVCRYSKAQYVDENSFMVKKRVVNLQPMPLQSRGHQRIISSPPNIISPEEANVQMKLRCAVCDLSISDKSEEPDIFKCTKCDNLFQSAWSGIQSEWVGYLKFRCLELDI